MNIKSMATALLAVGAALTGAAAVVPADVFQSSMVLQQGRNVPVWGTAEPGEAVSVSFAGQTVKCVADKDGRWRVDLAPLKMNKEPQEMVVSGSETPEPVKLNDILVGEVWLCSGQSNMELPLWGGNPRFRSEKGNEVAAKANFPLVRYIRTERSSSRQPMESAPHTAWKAIRPGEDQNISAVAFYFGTEISQKLDIPVGLLTTYWGGSRIEAWTSAEGFASVPELRNIADALNAEPKPGSPEYKQEAERYLKENRTWLEENEAALAAGKAVRKMPKFAVPSFLRDSGNSEPAVLHNAMIQPYSPFAVRGTIWYQGCSNLGDDAFYAKKMHALYNSFAKWFELPDMPFYFVQLAPFSYGRDDGKFKLAKISEAQQTFADENPNAAIAVINDVGNFNDIHPSDKATVGHRLALLALAKTYGQNVKADSPVLKSWELKDGKFVLTFSHAESWSTKDNAPVKNFEVAGEDGIYRDANVVIDGAKLVVSSPEVKNPVALRYHWKYGSEGNLYNEAGLLPGPFHFSK